MNIKSMLIGFLVILLISGIVLFIIDESFRNYVAGVILSAIVIGDKFIKTLRK